jgi:hypothetical protein
MMHRRQVEEDLDCEVQSHFDLLADRHVAQGMEPEAARKLAHLQFGWPEQVKQDVREARMEAAVETTLRDIRYARRALGRSPGFTAIAVATLAMGIGANTAIFSVIDSVMLRLLPVDHPEQLVLLTDPAASGVAVDTTEHGVRETLSYPEFEELRRGNKVFSGVFAAQNCVSELDVFPGGGERRPVKAHTQLVSGEFFRVLGIQPLIGRSFTPKEDTAPGASPVAVISYDYWQREFGGEPSVVGSTIRVSKAVFTILGVGPPGFHGILVGADADIWLPITMQE